MTELRHPKADNVKLAVITIIFTVFALSLGDALIKGLSLSFPLWQLFVLRSLIAIPALIIFIRLRAKSTSLMPKAWFWITVRSLLLSLMWVAYYVALPFIDLEVAGAVYYTLPLFITLLAWLFVGEKVSPIAWLAIGVGFLGVIVILRPSGEDFNWAALLPLISALFYAIAMLLTRTKCHDESPLILGLSLHVSLVGLGLLGTFLLPLVFPEAQELTGNAFLFGDWTTMNSTSWLAMWGLALAAVLGSVLGAFAYQTGPSATVATFDYCYLAFIALWGIIFFAEIPDVWTLVGMALIAVAGILAIRKTS